MHLAVAVFIKGSKGLAHFGIRVTSTEEPKARQQLGRIHKPIGIAIKQLPQCVGAR